MYSVQRHFDKFDTDSKTDMKKYEDILNDPLCTIITERIEKIREETYSEDTGRICMSRETLWKLVTWDQKLISI